VIAYVECPYCDTAIDGRKLRVGGNLVYCLAPDTSPAGQYNMLGCGEYFVVFCDLKVVSVLKIEQKGGD